MTRTLRAFLWLRWRTTWNTLRGRSRRDRMEQLSRALSTVLPVVLFFLLVPTALVIAGAGFAGGRFLANPGTGPLHRGWIAVGLRVLLFVVLFGVALSPLVRAGYGTGPNVTRLLLLPIRRRALHAAEVISAFGDPWLAVFVPGLLMLPVGMLSAGDVGPTLLVLVATLAFLGSVVLVSAGVSFLVALLFRRRRRAEWVTLVFITVFSVSGLVVGPFVDRWENDREVESARRAADGEAVVPSVAGKNASEQLDAALPRWTRAVPSELYVKAVTTATAGDPVASIGWSSGLVLWILALVAVSERAYGRLLDTPEESSGPRGAGSGAIRLARLPRASPRTAAVAWTHVRLALRTVRGKLAVFLPFIVLGLMQLVVAADLRAKSELSFDPGPHVSFGLMFGLAGVLLALLSLQPVMFNQYATDGTGLALLLLSPLSVRETVRGKLIGGAILAGTSAGLCAATGLLLSRQGSPWLWLALVPAGLSAYLLLAPLGAILSAVLPKAADLSRLGKHGNPHGLAAVAGTIVSAIVIAPPALVAVIAVYLLERPLLAFAGVGLWCLLTVLLYLPLERLATESFDRRRENLLLVATGH